MGIHNSQDWIHHSKILDPRHLKAMLLSQGLAVMMWARNLGRGLLPRNVEGRRWKTDHHRYHSAVSTAKPMVLIQNFTRRHSLRHPWSLLPGNDLRIYLQDLVRLLMRRPHL